MNFNTNTYFASESDFGSPRPPLVALCVLIFFAAFFPTNALATTAHLKEKAPKFIDKIQGDYGTMVHSAAILHDTDVKLILAVIVVESEGNEKVVSRKGAQGLMQLMPPTARAMGAKNIKEPLENILAGTRYLRELEENYGFASPGEVLVAYNMGPTRAKRWLLQHPPDEYKYVKNVMYVYNILEEEERAQAFTAESVAKKLAYNEELISLLHPFMAEPRTLSLADFPVTIFSGRRDEVLFEN